MHTGMRANRLAAAHRIIRLMLLGSPPDMVHGALSHRARLTACLYTRTDTHKYHLFFITSSYRIIHYFAVYYKHFFVLFSRGKCPFHFALGYCVKRASSSRYFFLIHPEHLRHFFWENGTGLQSFLLTKARRIVAGVLPPAIIQIILQDDGCCRCIYHRLAFFPPDVGSVEITGSHHGSATLVP